MRSSGVHVELDDFGTGYASLSHLSSMPLNGLKIDRSFVAQMSDDPNQLGIISAVLSMANTMGLRVVCEGVETSLEMDSIARMGDCSIQGYYIAKPMSFTDTTEWIRNGRNLDIFRAELNQAQSGRG